MVAPRKAVFELQVVIPHTVASVRNATFLWLATQYYQDKKKVFHALERFPIPRGAKAHL
jgi:hypothetical protein